MKGKLVLLTVLVAAFVIFVAIRFFILDSQNNFGELKIISTPTTSIFINNVAAGKTPFEEKYKAGEYLLKLIPEGAATESASWQGKVSIYRNAMTYVNRELGTTDINSSGVILTVTKMTKPPKNNGYGEVYIETEPNGALVYLDNDEKGVASMVMENVPGGEHELSAIMPPQFLKRAQKINIDGGYRVNAYFKLAIDPNATQIQDTTRTTQTATASAKPKQNTVIIKDTPTGFLRVREEPSLTASEAARVKPGETYDLLEEQTDWYKIRYEKNKEGWISSAYAEKQ